MTKQPKSGRVRGVLRVLGFLAVVNLVGTALYLPRARAAAEELALSRGLTLLKKLEPVLNGADQAMTINGQRLYFAARTTSLPLGQVLTTIERDCHDSMNSLKEQLGALPASVPQELSDPTRWFTVRESDKRAGQVTCFARQSSPGGWRGLVERLSAFARSGELSEIGDARYVVAQRDDSDRFTQVLAMWSESHFNLLEMFPEQGDAPGRDSDFVPRPSNSVRVLSAETPDRPYALRIYDSAQPPAEILAEYDRGMKQRGWARTEPPESTELDWNQSARAFSKDGRAVIVVVNETANEKTGVNLIELGSAGFATVSAGVSP
ncbi:MAG: hypothetical protein QM756_36750 [Polyangiaceae bacterium]